jgi:hypothetical protein
MEKQKSLSPLNNFEAVTAGYTERLRLADDANPSTKVAHELFELCRDSFFLQRVGELKLSYIANGVEAAIQTENRLF